MSSRPGYPSLFVYGVNDPYHHGDYLPLNSIFVVQILTSLSPNTHWPGRRKEFFKGGRGGGGRFKWDFS